MDALKGCVRYRRVDQSYLYSFGELILAVTGILTRTPTGEVKSVEEVKQ